MSEPLTLDAVLEGGLDRFLHPAAARRDALAVLPDLVATCLMRRVDAATRARWAARLTTEIWTSVRRERGERWDLGWAELMAGLAVAVELLSGELPRALQTEIQGTPAAAAWQRARRRFQRFVLLVDSAAHVRRVLAARRQRLAGVPVEQLPGWAVDGPAFRDRSHTLMLALLADGVLPDDAGPVAATGELLADGQGVGPVGGLVEKAEAWLRLYPDGLLVSAPPVDLDVWQWLALVRLATRAAADRGDRGAWPWIVGASLREIAAKLGPAATSIESWDGSPLAADALLAPRLSEEDPPAERPFGDPLLGAAWAAFREARLDRERRGVVIQGLPGSGKSVLSKTLERELARGALGAFGYGVRRSARELAADIELAPSRTWSAVLSVRAPAQAQLLETLEETRRLVPIVDGLDEVQPDQLQAIAGWLRAGRGWWIATSRPIRGVGAELPLAWALRLGDLQREGARKLLVAMGRRDLADAALPDGGGATPPTVQELTRTPLHVALLARVVRPGEDLRRLGPHELYERVFEALLDQACRSRRLTTTEATLVRQLLSTVLGELAIAWLRSAEGFLDRSAIEAAFEGAGLGLMERVHALAALEFGHLLVPAGARWELGHRTMAEWVAAVGLRRRVERALQRDPDEAAGRSSARRRAAIELAEIGGFLEDDLLPEHGRWATLLRFYAPFVKEPIFFLDRLLGPARTTTWRRPDGWRSGRGDEPRARDTALRAASSTEILESWTLAYDLLRLCEWRRPAEARTAWALAVRRWLLTELGGRRWDTREERDALRGFAAAIGEHLPESLDDLVALAARTEVQQARLRADPLLLLPAIPAARAAVLGPALERGEHGQGLAVLEWYVEHRVEPPHAALERMACDISNEIDRGGGDGNQAGVLLRLEAAVWKACLDQRREPPWRVVCRRLAAWPEHLDGALVRCFGAAPTAGAWPPIDLDDFYQRRRDVLASLLDQATGTHRQILDPVAALDSFARRRVLGRLKFHFNDSDDGDLRRIVEGLAAAQGWTEELDQGWEPGPIEDEPVAAAVCEAVRVLHQLRRRAARLVGAVDGDALDRIVGELWELLPPDASVRREILISLDGRDAVPRQVSAMAVVHHRGVDWRLDRIRWTDAHLDELRRTTRTGAGQSRYEAVCALAHAAGRDEVAELLQHLPSNDEGFTELAYAHIARRRSAGAKDAAPAVPDPARLPLGDRAARGVPGWRAELLARLAGDDVEALATLVDVAVRHEVREALPLLARRLTGNGWHDRRLIEAIALLATDRDEEVARVALRRALRVGWPDGRSAWGHRPREDERDTSSAGVAIARFLRIEDLDALAEGSVSALWHPSLAASIRDLGPDAITRLVELHGAAARRAAELAAAAREAAAAAREAADTTEDFPRLPVQALEQACKRRDALAETLIASLDPGSTTLAELVALLFRITGGDVHRVYSVLGALGSDFTEPEDMDFHSEQVNAGLVRAAARALEQRLARHPDEWPALRELFRHPSESVRKHAFELCADRAEPHAVAGLAIEALTGHVQENRTRWTGQTVELRLAGPRGAGSISIANPDTAESLVAAVRSRLTPLHKELVRDLSVHPLPAFRRLAAQWAGELGSDDWVDFVVPLLEDESAAVVAAALGALAARAPSRLRGWLGALRETAWTPAHDHALLVSLLPGDRATATFQQLMQWDREKPERLADHLDEATLIRLLAGAAGRAAAGPATPARAAVCFGGYPSLVERVLSASRRSLGPAVEELFRRWLDHPARPVREVGRRQLAARGLLDVALVESLLGALPADRFSGAECAVRMGVEHLREPALRVLRGALLATPGARGVFREPPREPLTEADLRAAGLEPSARPFDLWSRHEQFGPESERRARLLWALEGAPASFAAALALIAAEFHYDHAELTFDPEDEKIMDGVAALIGRWGEDGALAVLDLIDHGDVAAEYRFLVELRRAAERHDRVLAAIRDGAARGGAESSRLLEELDKDAFDRDLDGLARRLMDEIFPFAWPDSPDWR